MAADKLSAKEAALIAQAREQLGLPPAAGAKAQSAAPVARVERALPAAAIDRAAPAALEPLAPESAGNAAPDAGNSAKPGPVLDAAERVAALMAAARAESERLRQRRRKLYRWAPVAFLAILGLWTLLWMWHT